MNIKAPMILVPVGPAASGKSTWAKRMLAEGIADEHVSSDAIREELNLGPFERHKTFALFYKRIGEAAEAGKVAVADVTNLKTFARREILQTARNAPCVAVLLERLSVNELIRRDAGRERHVPHEVLAKHANSFRSITREKLLEEGFLDVVDITETFTRN